MIIHDSRDPKSRPAPVGPQPPAPVGEPVLLIHGTFANRAGDGPVDWWRPGSDYARALDARLAAEGSSARCWSHLGARDAPFAWTGANLETHRRDAGRALASDLAALERDPAIERYHLVTHSHGGNVVLRALSMLERPPAKLGAFVTMGTPALAFGLRAPFDARWIGVPLGLAAVAGCAWGWSTGHLEGFTAAVLGGAFAIAVGADVLFSTQRRVVGLGELYGSGRAHAFVFDGDEAIDGLMAAGDIVREPKRFLGQFTAPHADAVADFAVRPRAMPEPGIFDQAAASGVHAAIGVLDPTVTSTAAPSQARVPGWSLGIQTGLAPRVSTATPSPSWAQVLDAAPWVKGPVLLVLQLYLFLPRAFVAAVALTAAFLASLGGRVFLALAVPAARLAVRLALPILARRAAFGADIGRFGGVHALPPLVWQAEPLPPDVLAEVAEVRGRLGVTAGHSVLEAIRRDAFAIRSRVTVALGDPSLVHSQYYRSAAVIGATAALIARPSPPRLPTAGALLVQRVLGRGP